MANNTQLGKAYVQIMPSAKGVGAETARILDGELGNAGASSGNSFIKTFVKVAKGAIAAAGIGKAISASIMEGAALEQSLGGVEAIFGDAADTVIKNANEAFRTAGVSANQYMEGVTSFAASLMASTGGNAEQAASVADQAFRDMSDNANRFGTDMASIQSAYQGFAKQNYTMLDNLKLGYGGTKTEMERLLKDAQEISGVEYDIENLADVYTAIGVIQTKLNVTGTTAKEAATTFTGSLSMMKASVSNFLGALALGENIAPALQGMLQSMGYFAGNFLRLLVNVITSIPKALIGVDWAGIAAQVFNNLKEAFGAEASILATDLTTIQAFLQSITDRLPEVLAKGKELITTIVNGIMSKLPEVISSAGAMISTFVTFVMDNLPTVLKTGYEMLANLVQGIKDNLPAIGKAAFEAIANFLANVAQRLPSILQTGIEIIAKLVAGLIQAIPKIIAAIPKVIRAAVDAFKQHDWASTGRSIIDGIVAGIRNAGHLIADVLKGLAKQAWQGVKNFLGIGSPSKVFAEQIGRWIPAGIAEGIEANASVVSNALADLSKASLAQDINLAANLRSVDVPQGAANTVTNEDITINVYAASGMSVEALAEAVERRLIEAQNRRRLAWL